MNTELINRALQAATETRRVLMGPGTMPAVADLFGQTFGDREAIVIADRVTYDVAGRAVAAHFRSGGLPQREPFVFPQFPLKASYDNVAVLKAVLSDSDAIPVAVGSGTLNDITKLAAHECGRPYLSVATAPSMDGYVAFGAPLSRNGFKQSIACPAPAALLADVEILAAAPGAMVAAGYGDIAGKLTAGADWILADALGVEPILPAAWALVQPGLREWIGDPAGLRQGSPKATEGLIEGLVLSGLAMQAARTSRPASGCEHQMCHLWEMDGLTHEGVPVSHGHGVGVGTLAMTALYESMLEQDLTRLPTRDLCARWPSPEALAEEVRRSHPNPVLAEKSVELSLAKHLTPEQLAARLRRLQAIWPDLRERLRKQLIPATELRRMLQAAGSPAGPAEIGVSRAKLTEDYRRARQVRSRYTILDLCFETGLLESAIAKAAAVV